MTLGVFERETGHEQVVFCHDARTGLKAIVGLYSTALGPGLGGTRFYPYDSEDAAITDVLNLSRGMAYKNALANIPHGGGKAVIIGDPTTDKSDALLRAYARYIDSLGGRYITACDMGTTVPDMDIIAGVTRHVTGKSPALGGGGDPSVLTAHGVFRGMLACAEHEWGSTSLTGKRVGISGVGKVGHLLLDHVVDAGASVVITDVRQEAIDKARTAHPEVEVAGDEDELIRTELDIFAPCALGGVLNADSIPALRARVVCGAANNQLARDELAFDLHHRGVLYAPDYLVNAGGVINVADELHGYSFERAKARADQIFDTTRQVMELAERESLPPASAADRIAEHRMAEAAGQADSPAGAGA
ncbi:Glu/Leu/Phe/Val dehydrogenase dimerization domain-containing protein [Haloechinothrix sp. LS1_15]|uniref:Glu/Leu/Phe/Val dehydrogenase dimerization domain-containing protein n=1 Tax=Haloechinothrix sp. LS1_15 TaxID=2652248 RepID=UPI0029470C2A|nr:Glu/Leu/Phe/Val dehydrogenase dimerization domain-containing protein [Haloechinothrix sp. LS1_15]MDV6014350.1 Glu/Leu/Phe/Val dehydrogenase [Haloechinothrix sp. LS1_15]